jgi:hypothetical protein
MPLSPRGQRGSYADKYGGDSAFLCASLVLNTSSPRQPSQQLLLHIVQPMLLALRSEPTLTTNMAIMMTNTLLLLKDSKKIVTECVPFITMSELDNTTFNQFQTPVGLTYKHLLLGLVTTYFESYAIANVPELNNIRNANSQSVPFNTPESIVAQARDIAFSMWRDMEVPLQFKPNRVLIQTDGNREKLYFLTHVLFLGNHYGTRPLDSAAFPTRHQRDLYGVFGKWMGQFINKNAVKQNLEEFCEVSYSWLFLRNSLGSQTEIPSQVIDLAKLLLHTADSLPTHNISKHPSWYPQDRCKYDLYTDGHALMVAASLLVELVRHD